MMALSLAGLGCRLLAVLFLVHMAEPTPQPSQLSQAHSPATSSSTDKSAISGVVTDGETGRPISGALVSLSDPQVKVSVGTLTDSKGRFVFTDLSASAGYAFTVRKAGYYNLGKGQSDVFAGPLTSISLSDHEWRQHEDVVLWPFGTISGRVVDEQGEPVVAVPVRVLSRVPVGGSFQWVVGPGGITDDRGVYRVDQLQSGSYVVQVPNVSSSVPPTTSPAAVAGRTLNEITRNSDAGPPAFGLNVGSTWLTLGQYAVPPPHDGRYRAYPLVYYPNSSSFGGAVPIDLPAGEHRVGVDFALHPVSTAALSGRVVGPRNALPGMVVRLLSSDSPVENRNSELGTALVDDNGAFTILGVPPGRYTLVAASSFGELRLRGATGLNTPGLLAPSSASSTSSSGLVASTPGEGTPYYARTSLVVGAQDVVDVVLELNASATVSGRIANEDGSPLRDVVYVRFRGTGDPTFMAPYARVEPGAAAGRFVVRGLPEGDYRVDANFQTRPSAVKAVIGPGGDYTNRPFSARAGTDVSDVIITLTDRPAGLSGAVRDRDGAVVNQSAVILFPAERSRWSRFGVEPPDIRSGIATGRDGYKLSRLRAGHYLVVATDVSQRSAWHDSRFLEAAAAIATPVTLTWGSSPVLNLTLRQVIVR